MKRLFVLTAVAMLLVAPGCRGMRGGASCGFAEPVCGSPAFVDGGFMPAATTVPVLPGPSTEFLPPNATTMPN